MIDVGDETLITMKEAGTLLAKRLRWTTAPHASSLWRWREKGLLDGLKIAGKIYTSVEAIERFMQKSCNGKKTGARLSPARKRQIAKAKALCQRAGI